MINTMRLFRSVLFASLLFFVAGPVFSAEIPTESPPSQVSDLIDLLSQEDEDSLAGQLQTWRAEEGVEAQIVIIDSVSDYEADSIEQLATRWFNQWAIDDSITNDGMLFLVALGDREVRIEVGERYGSRLDAPLKRIVDNEITPRFRQERYADGLFDGVKAIKQLEQPSTVSTSNSSSNSISQPTSAADVILRATLEPSGEVTYAREVLTEESNEGFWQQFFAILTTVGAAGAGGYYFFRKPKCPVCETEMTLLDEVADDAHLTKGQQVEERIGSVNYKVWECGNCGELKISRRESILNRTDDCPQCRHRTGYSATTILEEATTYSTGLKKVNVACHHCEYRTSYRRTIPMIVEYDDDDSYDSGGSSGGFSGGSSGGSSGGGSSSGGGASGSW